MRFHQSTLAKVEMFSNVLKRTINGSLKTRAKWYEIHGLSIQGILSFIDSKWWLKLLLWFVSTVVAGIVGFYNTVYNIYASNNAYYSGADVPSMYLVDLNTGVLTGYSAEDTGATKFNSHQELLNYIKGEAK
jgi:hypothetical protein